MTRQHRTSAATVPASATLARNMTEAAFLRQVVDLAHLTGWLVHHCRPARTAKGWATPIQGDAGFPDLVLAKEGRVIFAELKREKAKPSEAQMEWIEALGELARVWYPSMWDSIVELLAKGE